MRILVILSSLVLLGSRTYALYPKLNTYTISGDDDPVKYFATASPQLAPVYNPAGGLKPERRQGGPTARHQKITKLPTYVTKTVYGFLDFVTTVGNTVMFFTPQSQVDKPAKSEIKSTESSVRFTVTASRYRPDPKSSSILHRFSLSEESSKKSISPQGALSIENLFTKPPASAEIIERRTKPKHQDPTPIRKKNNNESLMKETNRKQSQDRNKLKSLRESELNSNRPERLFRKRPTSQNSRVDVNFLHGRKRGKPTPTNVRGGSTLIPIIVEGTGKSPIRPTPILEPSRSAPPEVVVTAAQGFASLSVIGPFNTAIENNLDNDYDYSETQPLSDVQEDYLLDIEPTATLQTMIKSNSDHPTGLVTTMGGTIISDGLTTVHETNVIGTYIGNKYAQILQSTSRIFQVTPVLNDNQNSASLGYETVKSIIEGSATQFITPETESSLPLESLFSGPSGRNRNARLDGSKIAKRRGPEIRRPEYNPRDPYLDEGDDYDLARSGSNLRPSFRQVPSITRRRHVPTYREAPTTYRPPINPSTYRPDSFKNERTSKPTNRWRLTTSEKPKITINRRQPPDLIKPSKNENKQPEEDIIEEITDPTPTLTENEEETIRVETNYLDDESSNVWHETATIRSMHTFKVGITKNTRFVTFTRTFTKSIEPTAAFDINTAIDPLYETPLFENILDDPREITTLPPIDISEGDATALLRTVTESFSTTETLLKTSVLPIVQGGETAHYSMTQTYLITRVVTAIKTVPPVEAFSFIPENSLNEFNDQLLAEGTENEAALFPGEIEYDQDGETRVKPPPGFKLPGPSLSQFAGGNFNPEALEKHMHPELVAALQSHNQGVGARPELFGTQQFIPSSSPALPTPSLTPEQLQQLAYIRLMNPYAAAAFGGFPQQFQHQQQQQQQHTTVSSSPVTITTDITTTSTRLIRVIFNARPIMTAVTNVETIHTTIVTYNTVTVTLANQLPSYQRFPFPGFPYGAG